MRSISSPTPVKGLNVSLVNKFALLKLDAEADASNVAGMDIVEGSKNKSYNRRNKKRTEKQEVLSEKTSSEEDSSIVLFGGWEVKKKYVVCIDFEATCVANVPFDKDVHEIIEFPAIAIDTFTNKKVAEFHSYVKPTKNPVLSNFCTTLTGITQDVIDNSPEFSVVLSKFQSWVDELLSGKFCAPEDEMSSENSEALSSEERLKSLQTSGLVFATHGQADILNFFKTTCKINKIPVPSLFKAPFINIQRTACKIFKKNRSLLKGSPVRTKSGKPVRATHFISLENLCRLFDIPFVGRCHNGLDDARMVATILQKWALSDYTIKPNS